VSGTLAAGETATRSFAARAGDSVLVHAGGPLDWLEVDAPNTDWAPASLLAQTGVYTIVLGSSAGGSFSLTLEAVSGSINGGGNGWSPLVCGSGVPDGSREIACGQLLAGSLDLAGDSDTYTFLAEAGDVVTLTLSDGIANFDPVAELYGPDGASLLLSGGAACGPNQSCVSPALPTSGVYTIRVLEPTGAGTGAYSVGMNRSPCASDCQDGIDNDGDGLIDYPADPGCTSAADLSERPECSDGLDNDGDGAIDFAGGDPGCASAESKLEDPACNDGRDNDLDGAIDWDGGHAGAADSYCASAATGSREAPPPPPGCGIGPELALLLPLLAALRRRVLPRA